MDRLPIQLDVFIHSLQPGSRILIPGCGDDYGTIDAFDRAGHHITAIDFSPIAIEQTRTALPRSAERIILGDFFHYNFGPAAFDVVYERTFLCSLPPRLREAYVARVAQLLRPRGTLAGFFFYGPESDPPPFPINESTASQIFGRRFELIKSEPVADSLPIFTGQEKWQEWQLR